MQADLKILLLEDSRDDADLVERVLKKEEISFHCRIVESKEDFKEGLEDFLPDVVISDHSLPQFNSQEALKLFHDYKATVNPTAVFVLVTGTVSEEFAVKIMKEGADDYILKDRLTRLPSAIMGALEKNRIAEQKRRAEEEKLQLLEILQKSLNEIYIFDSENLKCKYANEEALRNLGFSLDEIKEMTPLDLLEGISQKNFRDILLSVGKSRNSRIFETYLVRKDRSRFPAQVHLQLIEEHAGKKTFMANVLDITEIKIQEQQKDLALFIQDIFNTYSELKTCLNLILEGICRRKNLDAGEIFTFNFERTSLISSAIFDNRDRGVGRIGKHISEMVLQSQQPVLFQDLLKEELPEELKKETRFKSAKAFPIGFADKILAVVILFSETKCENKDSFTHLGEGLRNQIANNLERKKTEDELRKIFLYSPEVQVIASTDGYFKRINPFFAELLGFSEEEILNTPFKDFLHPDDRQIIVDWKANMAKHEVIHYQNRFRTRDGEYVWIAWSVTPFLEDTLSFAVGMDITKEKKNLEAIEIQNRKLAEIAWEQSHVVRAPLARMMGCIHHLEDSKEPTWELLENIKASAHEVDSIIKAIVKKSELIKIM